MINRFQSLPIQLIKTKTANLFSVATFAIFLCFVLYDSKLSFAQSNQSYQDTSTNSKIYTHPSKGFTLYIPNSAVLNEREPPVDITLNSRQGWGMTIQSAPANPSLTIEDLAARLETKYLGEQKTWSQKIQGTRRIFKGYEAYDSIYDGSGMRARVVIIRSPSFDYVLMFIAPSDLYISTANEFESILLSFEPTHRNAQHHNDDLSDTTLNPQRQASASHLSDPLIQEAPHQTDFANLDIPTLGYSILYPTTWRVGKPDDFTVVFTGPSKSEAAKLAVTIQNVSSAEATPPDQMANAILQQLKIQMAYSASDVKHVGGGEIAIAGRNGVQLVSDYNRGPLPYRQWSIIIPRSENNIVHVWTYTAPQNLFNDFSAVMETMVNSWSLN